MSDSCTCPDPAKSYNVTCPVHEPKDAETREAFGLPPLPAPPAASPTPQARPDVLEAVEGEVREAAVRGSLFYVEPVAAFRGAHPDWPIGTRVRVVRVDGDSNLNTELTRIATELRENATRLPEDAARVLNENLFDLYAVGSGEQGKASGETGTPAISHAALPTVPPTPPPTAPREVEQFDAAVDQLLQKQREYDEACDRHRYHSHTASETVDAARAAEDAEVSLSDARQQLLSLFSSTLADAQRWRLEAIEGQQKQCQWVYDDVDGFYQTSCGNAFWFDTGTPAENKAKFCCYCGAALSASTPREGGP